jgi:PKD domain
MTKTFSAAVALVAALALTPAAFGAVCADCEPGGGGGGGSSNNAPSAAFTISDANVDTFENVSFTNTSSDSDGSIASSSWNFGDGATIKIAKAGKGKITIKLSSKAKKALKGAKVVKLTLVTTATDAAGNKTTKTTKVQLV